MKVLKSGLHRGCRDTSYLVPDGRQGVKGEAGRDELGPCQPFEFTVYYIFLCHFLSLDILRGFYQDYLLPLHLL